MSAVAAPNPSARTAGAPSSRGDRPAPGRAARSGVAVAAVVAAGAAALLLGAATEVGQGVLPTAWGPLAGSVAAWAVIPALLAGVVVSATGWRGRRAEGLGAVSGLVATEALVAGYYGWAALVSGTPHAVASVAVWAGAGVVSGALVGACAAAVAAGSGHVRGAALGLLGALVLADGLRSVLLFPWQAAGGWLFVVSGVLVATLLPRRGERTAAGLVLVCSLALGAGGYAVLDAVVTLAGSR
ncbi:DUF6518 family protein [Quadrisphaera sp. INWT6]|uniref:DUF6518 family protein n=1 Tax=Quadrisphaera sp. INWT6 TaxID=2596917 RepID=UPI00189242EA|nr:DUF6518 family protein [Quadrisphaera sp. INWT6]MBF5081755.1 hypothetical protein [Quadrisphaera sp. INWT6]